MVGVVTRHWDQEILYDESDTDAIGSRYHLTFEGHVHAQTDSAAGGPISAPQYVAPTSAVSGVHPALVLADVKSLLSEPRKELSVSFGTQQIIACNPATSSTAGGADVDVENGPKPRHVEVTHVVTNKIYKVHFSIDFTLVHCGTSISNYVPVLNNRWSISEAMDENHYVTRRIQGRMRLSSATVPAQAVKGVVVPGRENGFRRMSVEYTVAPNGLDVDYTVVDRQTHTAAPSPATSISGTHTETTNDGVMFASQLSVRLEGPISADKRDLIQRGLQIVDAKLNYIALTDNNNRKAIPINFSIIDHFGERNVIEIQVAIKHVTDSNAELLSRLRTDVIGKTLELPPLQFEGSDTGFTYDSTVSRYPELYGENHAGARSAAVATLLQCYLQTPCDNQHAIAKFDDTGPPSEDGSDDEYGTKVKGRVGELQSSDHEQYSPDHTDSPYTYSRMETTYRLRQPRAHLPIARRVGQGVGQATSSIATLAQARGERIIKCDFERVGAQPILPQPMDSYTDGDLVGRLLSHDVVPMTPTTAADGQGKIYRTVATYRYALSRPPIVGESIKTGVHPYLNFSLSEVSFRSGDSYQDKV